MKTVKSDYGKINFVDDNNILVGFDNESSCCESFGYFFSRAVPSITDEGAIDEKDLDLNGFQFDRDFFVENNKSTKDEYFESGGMVTFRLTRGDEQLFLSLHNSHNGYYSHGFNMTVGGQIVDGPHGTSIVGGNNLRDGSL